MTAEAAQQTNEIKKIYKENFSSLTLHIEDDLNQWINDSGDELVLEALKRAIEAGKNYNYAKGILKNWKKNEICTIEEVEKQDQEYAGRKKKSFTRGGNSKKESVPEWLKEDPRLFNEDKENSQMIDEKLLRLRKLREQKK